jgi:tetratricopeptide (TPR) repeat protein
MSEQRDQNRFVRLLKRGTELLSRGKPQQAISYLERARKIAPDNFDVKLNLSGAYILTKKFKAAVKILEELRASEPQNVMVWTNLGAAYLGNPVLARPEEQEQAIAAFKTAYELDVETPNAAYNIGLIYRDRREYHLAEHWFGKALQTNPQDNDARSLLAQMREKGGGGRWVSKGISQHFEPGCRRPDCRRFLSIRLLLITINWSPGRRGLLRRRR